VCRVCIITRVLIGLVVSLKLTTDVPFTYIRIIDPNEVEEREMSIVNGSGNSHATRNRTRRIVASPWLTDSFLLVMCLPVDSVIAYHDEPLNNSEESI
jgi:hypothetical protein